MKKRYAVLGLSVFLALALAVPAFGGPSNPIASISASVKSTANKALKKAKSAEKTAKTALSTANAANSAAGTAGSDAKKAQTTASSAQTTANTAQSEAKKAQTTANEAKANAATAKAAADAAQGTANTAKAVAEEAKAEAAEGIKFSSEAIGTANPSTGTNTTTPKSASAECEPDEEVLGGGFFVNGESEKVAVHTSNPQVFYANGWFAEGAAITGTPTWSIQVDVMCGIK